MHAPIEQHTWEEYKKRELAAATPLLRELGYELEHEQPHIGGERFLMGTKKLVLIGRSPLGARVAIKMSSDAAGKKEIAGEHARRAKLAEIPFAYEKLPSPKELAYFSEQNYTISVVEYIEEEMPFLARPIEQQFSLLLHALKIQEGFHATTSAHVATIKTIFDVRRAREYPAAFSHFRDEALQQADSLGSLATTLHHAGELLVQSMEEIDRYTGFLTHEDFVPHNLRIRDETVYLIDYDSLRFGNKHESWARLMNFMLLYNRDLEQALVQYVSENRAMEEARSVRLMRIYKLGQLIAYHAQAYRRTHGELKQLSRERVLFWERVLRALLDKTRLADDVINAYKQRRDALRSKEEKNRQKVLGQF